MDLTCSAIAAEIAKRKSKEYYADTFRHIIQSVSDRAQIGAFSACVDISSYIRHTENSLPITAQVESIVHLLRLEGFTVSVYEKEIIIKLLISWK